jgi:hypothetical protein
MNRRNFFSKITVAILAFFGFSNKATKAKTLIIKHDMDGKYWYYYGLITEDLIKDIAQGDEKAIESLRQHFQMQFSDFVDKIQGGLK